MEDQNVNSVREIYAAFGAGDIPAILEYLSSDVVWNYIGPDSIPFAGERHGLEGVEAFFASLRETIDFTGFAPRHLVAQDDRVVVLGWSSGTVRATGKSYDGEWAMAWTFRDGLVTHFCHYADQTDLVTAMVGTSP